MSLPEPNSWCITQATRLKTVQAQRLSDSALRNHAEACVALASVYLSLADLGPTEAKQRLEVAAAHIRLLEKDLAALAQHQRRKHA